MAIPGMAHSHHAVRRTLRPAPTWNPQLITLGSARPRKESPDSIKIAVATMSEPRTMTGERQFGRMWRSMIRPSLIPSPTQAWTNSRSRIERNWPRTRRATAGHETTAMAMTVLRTDGLRMATSTMAKMKDGIVWKNSVTRIRRSSAEPP